MCRRGMTSYIGAAWRLKPAAMSISTKGGHLPGCFAGLRTRRWSPAAIREQCKGTIIPDMTNKIFCAPPPVFYESKRDERFETGIAPGMSGLEWTRK
jgi:hypothetical protein